MRPDLPPSAKFLSFSTRFRVLGPVFFINWNRLGDLVLRVGAAGLFASALADNNRGGVVVSGCTTTSFSLEKAYFRCVGF